MAASAKKFTVALCQLLVTTDKPANLAGAAKAIAAAAKAGADMVALPEIFNGPYATTEFEAFAEPVPDAGHTGPVGEDSPSCAMLQAAATTHGVYVVGGSVAEACDGALYNTSTVWSPEGTCIAKHRKVHLFDIDIPGSMTFKESDTLTAGHSITTFDTPWGVMGLGICYDMRFPAQAAVMREAGAVMLWYPGAFNTTTGPKHWELLQRARAVDNQVFVATCSPARNPDSTYQAWGHSTLVSPWAEVLSTCDEAPGMVMGEVDLAAVHTVRANIPISTQTRTDLYSLPQAAVQ